MFAGAEQVEYWLIGHIEEHNKILPVLTLPPHIVSSSWYKMAAGLLPLGEPPPNMFCPIAT